MNKRSLICYPFENIETRVLNSITRNDEQSTQAAEGGGRVVCGRAEVFGGGEVSGTREDSGGSDDCGGEDVLRLTYGAKVDDGGRLDCGGVDGGGSDGTQGGSDDIGVDGLVRAVLPVV